MIQFLRMEFLFKLCVISTLHPSLTLKSGQYVTFAYILPCKLIMVNYQRPLKLNVEFPVHHPCCDFRMQKWKSWKFHYFEKNNTKTHFCCFGKVSVFFHNQKNQQQCPTLAWSESFTSFCLSNMTKKMIFL